MHRMFPCFLPFHFANVEFFTGSGYSENPHVVYFNAKLIILYVAHWEEHLSSVCFRILVFAALVAFSFLNSSSINLLSRKALKLEKQYFVLRLLCVNRCMSYYALNRIGDF